MGTSATGIVHVIFTPEGIPRWFGPEPVPGSAPLDLEELSPLLPTGASRDRLAVMWRDLLIRHCRVDGEWRPRPEPSPAPDAPVDDTGIGPEPAEEQDLQDS